MFADVIVDITNTGVDRIFEYKFNCEEINLGSRVRVPFGSKSIEGIVTAIKNSSEFPPEKIKEILCVLDDMPVLTKETALLSDFIAKRYYVTKASALRLFLPSEMRKGKVKEQFISYVDIKEDIDVNNAIESLRKSAVKQKELLLYLKENGKQKHSQLVQKFGASAVKGSIDKGITFIVQEQYKRTPYKSLSLDNKQLTLTEPQKNAINSIEETDKTTTLLFGVTGSGKTEVYLNLISSAIKKGQTAIMLVPEIALTPQMFRQMRARFGDEAAILHSGLSAGERFDEWWRLRSGEAKIAIGARSAIFAPLENVGVIIIDEEHDGSYQSESAPRYSTIELAKYRAEFNNAKLVLGSATPSVESFTLAKSGDYNLVTLKERINKKPLPEVEIADMKKEIRRGNNSVFSSALKYELEECFKKGNQAILFLNQRGYSKSVICTECGHVQTCDSCDVSLTYHKEDDSLLCHYCGAKYKMITACTECGSKFLHYGGTGTERVVLELKQLFPSAKILRMDRDTTANKEGHLKILSAFAKKEADILVGTQMIAKGHDFPSVTLVGILDADASLHFSDFRSAERTFQLITQVAGRSGRAEEKGKVVLQTYSPEHPVLMQAIKYDYEGFYKQEISIRKATHFPPFTDIIRVLVTGENEDKTLAVTKQVYDKINDIYNANRGKFRFFGCMKAPIKRLQKKFRFQVLMRVVSGEREVLDSIYKEALSLDGTKERVYLEINPNNLT